MMKENAALLTGNDRFEGYLADILRLIAASLRFDYEICLSTDGKYGERNIRGKWNGIVGEVVRGVSIILRGRKTLAFAVIRFYSAFTVFVLYKNIILLHC